ncbi:unnamed protein product [Adineta steineri]|uniref:Uncharacterized protein n=2 Tax=Adineta steineri TaxID=433720 RepID=A0A815EGC1_9BILA|nr:unnamed protein product [Adineta steineri]
MNENQQQTEIIQENKDSTITLSECLIRHNDKQTLDQLSTLGEISVRLTNLYMFEESIRRTMSTEVKSTIVSPSSVPLRTTVFQLEPPIFKNNNYILSQSNIDDTLNDEDQSKIFQYRKNNCQQNTKNERIKSSKKSGDIEHEIEVLKDIDQPPLNPSIEIYEYKSPFSKEYDQAISIQAQMQTNNNMNEWSLKDFYRDVKTNFEPETNTKAVFERCLKLARLQAITVKWEQRRRHNETIYNRSIKSAALDMLNTNGNILAKINNNDKDINELKRELRCSECKRFACVGNCTISQEYPQYKRLSPVLSLPNTREQIHSKFNTRLQRSTIDLRPRTTQHIIRETKLKSEQTKLNPVVVVPLFNDELQMKHTQKKFTNSFLPGKLIRSQRRETVAIISTNKVLS